MWGFLFFKKRTASLFKFLTFQFAKAIIFLGKTFLFNKEITNEAVSGNGRPSRKTQSRRI